ncbi:MAG: ChaN family lipoprotein, partial [Puniceicoccales bacterium]
MHIPELLKPLMPLPSIFFLRRFLIRAALIFKVTLGSISATPASETDSLTNSPSLPNEPDTPVSRKSSPINFWIDLYRAEPVRFAEVIEDLAGVDIVYTGEIHTLDRHHYWQTRILTELIQTREGRVVLALEQIEGFQQPLVDQ